MTYQPGIYPGLSWADYRAIPAWNPSLVKSARISMKQVQYWRTHPMPITPAMRLGSAVHCAVLEPDEFARRYVVWNEAKRGNIYKTFKAACRVSGQTILGPSDYNTCLAARDSAMAHPVAGDLLSLLTPKNTEVSIVWVCRVTGLLCKGRIDGYLEGAGTLIIDLKTTGTKIAEERRLKGIATDKGYHISLAAYQDGISTLTGEIPDTKILFVEQNAPWDVRVMSIKDALVPGHDRWVSYLARIRECEESGVWPGCSEEESELHVWDEGGEYEQIDWGGIE